MEAQDWKVVEDDVQLVGSSQVDTVEVSRRLVPVIRVRATLGFMPFLPCYRTLVRMDSCRSCSRVARSMAACHGGPRIGYRIAPATVSTFSSSSGDSLLTNLLTVDCILYVVVRSRK